MKKTIFNVYVVMESKEQCDRMQQFCLNAGLNHDVGYSYSGYVGKIFEYCNIHNEFGIWINHHRQIQVTEQEFLQLLKEYKDEK